MINSFILALNIFQNSVNKTYDGKDATLEIIIMLLVAFLFGFLLRQFIGFKKKEFIIEHDENVVTTTKVEGSSYDTSNIGGEFEEQLSALKKEVERLSKLGLSSKPKQKTNLIHSPAIDSVEDEELSIINIEEKNIEAKNIVPPSPKKEETKAKNDDLKVIEGVGPAIEKLLNSNGINTYDDLSKESVKKLEALLDEAGPRFRVHIPETWPEQAKLLKEGKIEEFKVLTERLKGGRRV